MKGSQQALVPCREQPGHGLGLTPSFPCPNSQIALPLGAAAPCEEQEELGGSGALWGSRGLGAGVSALPFAQGPSPFPTALPREPGQVGTLRSWRGLHPPGGARAGGIFSAGWNHYERDEEKGFKEPWTQGKAPG